MDMNQTTDHEEILMLRKQVDTMAAQVAEMHSLMQGLANALNNPMLKAMLPPQMRGMLGG
jgi:hypothetical protein